MKRAEATAVIKMYTFHVIFFSSPLLGLISHGLKYNLCVRVSIFPCVYFCKKKKEEEKKIKTKNRGKNDHCMILEKN